MINVKRLKMLQEKIGGTANFAFILPGSNFYYLTGYTPSSSLERLFLLVISSHSPPYIIAPKMYEEELKELKIDTFLWDDNEDPYKLFEEKINRKKESVFFVEESMPSGILISLNKVLKEGEVELLGPKISELRLFKDDDELKNLQKAAMIADRVFAHILNEKILGLKETEVADLIVTLTKRFGGEAFSFEPIVASGPNGANPHHKPGNRKIKKGDFVTLDFGALYNGYCSDMTRTVAIDNVTNTAKKVYEIVKNANENAFKTVRKGIKIKEVDLAARNHIENNGYGKYFIHRTGHGIGLEIHEAPFITPLNEAILQNRMVFTIEPGIYIPNKFGVRVEDDIQVNEKGIRLTKSSRELMIL
jgi:Xaa-Pro dipeptidase